MKFKKPKVAIISLTSCEGCQFAILDLGQKFLELTKKIEIVRFRLLADEVFSGYYDIAFVEGNPTTEEQFKTLKKIRQNSRFLVVLGNCAAMGGIQEIKNYGDKDKTIKQVYKYYQTLINQEIIEVSKAVDVDFTIPGCPINGEEFLQCIYDLLAGKKPRIPERPVCYECQINQYPCLLQQGKICFGPWTKGGCGAICLKSGQPCWGCRGLLKDVDIEKMFRKLKEITGQKDDEIKKIAEVFGLRDDLELNSKSQIRNSK